MRTNRLYFILPLMVVMMLVCIGCSSDGEQAGGDFREPEKTGIAALAGQWEWYCQVDGTDTLYVSPEKYGLNIKEDCTIQEVILGVAQEVQSFNENRSHLVIGKDDYLSSNPDSVAAKINMCVENGVPYIHGKYFYELKDNANVLVLNNRDGYYFEGMPYLLFKRAEK